MPRPKLVFDTNAPISSLWRGSSWQVVKAWREGRVWLVLSKDVLGEYLRVVGRFVQAHDLAQWAQVLTDPSRVLFVTPHELLHTIPHDPPDNRFLECAVAAAASAIVSRDRDLLRLKAFRDIPILTPPQTLNHFELQ